MKHRPEGDNTGNAGRMCGRRQWRHPAGGRQNRRGCHMADVKIYRCKHCGKLSSNRIAADDNPMKLMALAMKPVVSDFLDKDRLKEMLSSMQSQGDLI